jgi:hypothetical protein
MCIVTITLHVQSQDNERSCVLLPLHYLYKARTMRCHLYCYHYTICTKPGKWAFICIVTITPPVQSQDIKRHVYCYHYTTCAKPGQWASCVLLPLHYLYKLKAMSGHVYCYHYTTCTKPDKWAVICIVTITLPVQTRTMRVHMYCYHYHTCTKPGQWAVMCNITITLPVKSQVNERSCVLWPLLYLYKPRKMSGHVYCCHYTTCTKPGKWALMCIVPITLPVQSQVNERSCVLLPLHYLYKAR